MCMHVHTYACMYMCSSNAKHSALGWNSGTMYVIMSTSKLPTVYQWHVVYSKTISCRAGFLSLLVYLQKLSMEVHSKVWPDTLCNKSI
jgi:hypothetical protein